MERIADTSEKRLNDMDNNMISFQVLSRGAAVNATSMEATDALQLIVELNDAMYNSVAKHPGRFAALGELPFQAPDLAIEELRRCVTHMGFKGIMLCGSVGGNGLFLDDPQFDKLLSTFEELDVPLFLHPGVPPKAVIDTYYRFPASDNSSKLTAMLAGPGWGWHSEVAIHVLRLAVSGTLDRHPKLKIVIGHQGEMLPMMLRRAEEMFDQQTFGYDRTVAEVLRSQVWIAISGFFTIPETLIAIQRWGIDKVLFACDYPFVEAEGVPKFVKGLSEVIAPEDVKKICQTNAEALFKIKI